mmetsp:Transcript_1201/g.1317  ORF Transcript_1201/g.1317 Transcript_1201/m.1317 type:complete len:106 (-) Transcript_1201:355-672(-)
MMIMENDDEDTRRGLPTGTKKGREKTPRPINNNRQHRTRNSKDRIRTKKEREYRTDERQQKTGRERGRERETVGGVGEWCRTILTFVVVFVKSQKLILLCLFIVV